MRVWSQASGYLFYNHIFPNLYMTDFHSKQRRYSEECSHGSFAWKQIGTEIAKLQKIALFLHYNPFLPEFLEFTVIYSKLCLSEVSNINACAYSNLVQVNDTKWHSFSFLQNISFSGWVGKKDSHSGLKQHDRIFCFQVIYYFNTLIVLQS